VSLARSETTYEFVPVNARPFVTVRVDVRGAPDPTAVVVEEIAQYDVADAVVRVIISATPDNELLLRDRDIEAALQQAAFIAAVQREIDYPVRTRLQSASPESLSPRELLERYLITKGATPERMALLLEYADALFEAEEE
jgi:exonuclease SbcD